MNEQNNQNNYYQEVRQIYSGQYYQPPGLQNPPYQNMQFQNSYLELSQMKRKQKKDLLRVGFVIGCAIVAYLACQMIVVSLLQIFGWYDIYTKSSLFQNCFSIIGVHIFSLLLPFGIMAIILRKKYVSPIIPTAKIKSATAFSWIAVGMVWCLVCNIIVGIVMNIVEEMGYKLTQGELLDPDSAFACVVLVFSTAIVPGVIEEFAMRCCTLGVLRRYGAGFGVFAVSVVFGLLHGNVIQFIYAFLVGLLLAYITINTGSVVPAMFIHAFANGLSVIKDIVKYAADDSTADSALLTVVIFWMFWAAVGVIYLLRKKQLLPNKGAFAKAKDDLLSFPQKLLCLIPGFFVPFALLIILTATTVHKI